MTKHAAFIAAAACCIIAGAGCHRSDDANADAAEHIRAMAKEARAQHAGFSATIPIIRVENLRKAQAYYRDQLGYKLMWEDGDPPDFGAVKRGNSVFFMCQQCQGRNPSWSFIFVDEIDDLYRELKERGAVITQAPQDEPWGLREMHVADGDGNVIRFAGEGDEH